MSQESTRNFRKLNAKELRDLFSGPDEIAVLDVRENAVSGRDGHPLLIASIPLSRLELEIAAAVPRLSTPVVVFDEGGDRLAERAAVRLAELGYDNVAIFAGGVKAWADAGYEIFTGANVLSIAFGEFAEHTYGTPHISATDLKSKLENRENVVVLDSRTIPEFHNFSIPGAVDLPGAELVYRFHNSVPDPDALVVVNCAGRTRSIIGAQALINAGVPNKVVSLANGTMDWLIAGFKLQQGVHNFPALPTGGALEKAKASGERLRARFPFKIITRSDLADLQADRSRTTYLFDVRTEEEFLAGHVPGARWAEGGQLVQGTQRWASTQNARIVLADSSDLVRASITASWLVQINWSEVYVLSDAEQGPLEIGAEPLRLAAPLPAVETVSAEELGKLLGADSVTVIDLDTSINYRLGHVTGAHFAIRERLAGDALRLPGTGTIALTSADGRLAAFAAAELAATTDRQVVVLKGGNAAWKAAGQEFEIGETSLLHPAEDVHLSPYQGPEADRFPAFRKYLGWELGLVEQLDRDGTHKYRVFPLEAPAAVAAE